MPFVSQRDERQVLQNVVPFQEKPDSSFSDVFGAAIGIVFDEESSISGDLNREGEQDRRRYVEGLIASEQVNPDDYRGPLGTFDYNKLSNDLEDPNVRSDATLHKERAELLAKRRAYGQDVIERGSGMAQFLGSATAYMLDPVNIVTMPIATANVASKSLTTLGAALMVGKREAALAIAAETVIQPFVFQNKEDIRSPWSYKDSAEAIITGAAGAFLLGGTVGGVSKYLTDVKDKVKGIQKDIPELNTPEVEVALENITRQADTMSRAPQEGLEGLEGQDLVNKMLENDMKFMDELETKRAEFDQPNRTGASYEPTIIQEEIVIPSQTKSTRERTLLDAQGLTKDFDNDMSNYNALESKSFTTEDGQVLDTQKMIDDFDQQIDEMDAITVCAYG